LTARTARAREQLDRIPTLIARYKQRLLELAFSGAVTAHWRSANGIAANASSRSDGLWETPTSWEWRRVDEVGKLGLGRQRSPKNHEGPHMRPYMRSANITWKGIDTSDVKEMNFDVKDFERFQLKYGDVLLNEGSGSAKEVGKPAIWRDEIPDCCFQNTILRVQPEGCSSEYLYWYFLLTAMSAGFVDSAKGVGIQHISRTGLARYMVPVPTPAEQAEIVRCIEAAFAWLDRIVADHAAAAHLIPKLDAAILATAFRGELVPQDPNDEPAGVLLKRAAEERRLQSAQPRKRKTNKSVIKTESGSMEKPLEQILAEADDWLPAQTAFNRCGFSSSASTEDVEHFYFQLRTLDLEGKLDVEAVNDMNGTKLYDNLRLKVA
jgi:type I restriction enzyme, S subunit